MRTPQLAFAIMESVVKAVAIPVTMKTRRGWDESSVNAVQMAKLAQEAGIAAVAIHGRTREQFYSGFADWDIIRQVKSSVSIPVFGNGDIRSPQDAERMFNETGCDGVMVGRGAQGNPWLFRQIKHYFQTGETLGAPALEERIQVLLRHVEMLIALKGEYIAIREMRSHAAWYTKGLPKSAELRLKFNQAVTKEDFITIMNEFRFNARR